MDPLEKRELKRKAWMRLAAQRNRAGVLRGRVVVISLLCFALLWGVVFAQMATGSDPVLSGKEKAVATRSSASSAKREVETTDPRELEPERVTNPKARVRESEEAEVEPAEAGVEPEPKPELVEPEPLVTSQS